MSKSKKAGKRSGGKDVPLVCAMCKNYKPGKGMCGKHDKKRDPDDKACGSFKRR